MKKISLALLLGLLVISSLYAQQTVVIERPGVLTDLANAAGTIVALPLAVVEGIVVGTTEAAGSLLHGSTQVIVTRQSPFLRQRSLFRLRLSWHRLRLWSLHLPL